MKRFVLSAAAVVLVLTASGQARAEDFEDCKYWNHLTKTWDLDFTKMRIKMEARYAEINAKYLNANGSSNAGYQQPSPINPPQLAPNLQQLQQPVGYWFYDPYYGWQFYRIR